MINGTRNCPLCDSSVHNELKSVNCLLFDDCPVSSRFQIVCCGLCGFVFYDTPSGIREWDEFYAKHYLIKYYENREKDQTQQELLWGVAKFLEKANLPKGSFISDIGCGPGHLLTVLKKFGYANVSGIDVCLDFVEELRKREIPLFEGRAEKLPFADQSVDCLIYSHILEHLVEPKIALKEMMRCIRKDGFVLIEQPDLTRYDELSDFIPLNHFIFEHINHFDQFHVESFFLQGGFILHSKEFLIKDNTPVLRMLFRKADEFPLWIPGVNFESYERIKMWFHSNNQFKYTEAEELVKKGYKLYMWGISYQSLMHYSQSHLSVFQIEHFFDIDPRKQIKTIQGKPIVSPEKIFNLTPKDIVLVGVGPSTKIMETILVRQNFTGKYSLL